jgi:hypothetical protein
VGCDADVKLPNGERADLDDKLGEYVLNPQHEKGRHKARVFASALGITRDNAEILASALRKAAANSSDAVATGDHGFGATFEISFQFKTEKGSARVLSAWIVRKGEDFPRLTTCFII